MTKNAAVNFGYHCHNLAQIYNGKEIVETVAVIGKVDCRVFCHINCLGDKISNTAASIQPNPFWFWEKYIYIYRAALYVVRWLSIGFRTSSSSTFNSGHLLVRLLVPDIF